VFVGTFSDASTTITAGLTATGVVGTSSATVSTDAVVGLTATGAIDELHPAPPLIIPNRYVGPMALRAAFRRADWWTSPGFDSFNGSSVDTAITVGLTATGVVGTVSDTTATAIIVGLTASGAVGTVTGSTVTARHCWANRSR